jgi:hypothetical protein
MKLPNADRAVVAMEKLRDYCLSITHSPAHPRGRHKARDFATALGITSEDVQQLKAAILSAVIIDEATTTEEDEYGQRFVVDFSMKRLGKEATVRSSWIIHSGEDYPQLTSCYVL